MELLSAPGDVICFGVKISDHSTPLVMSSTGALYLSASTKLIHNSRDDIRSLSTSDDHVCQSR